jgi:hypothetical protein
MRPSVEDETGFPALPADLAEWVGAVKLMQLALEATEGVRIGSLEFSAGGGSPACPTRMLVTLMAYSYSRGIYSSQDIEDGVRRQADLRYLCAGDFPDANTLRRFRRQHWTELLGVLSRLIQQVVGGGMDSELRTETAAESRLVRAVQADSLSLE